MSLCASPVTNNGTSPPTLRRKGNLPGDVFSLLLLWLSSRMKCFRLVTMGSSVDFVDEAEEFRVNGGRWTAEAK